MKRTVLVLRGLLLALGAAFVWMLLRTIPQSGALGAEIQALLVPTWGLVTLSDLYLGFVLSAIVIIGYERRLIVGVAWAAPIFVLGNLWTIIWFVIRLPQLWRRLRG
ncbi:MAG: hypothetical protein ACFB2Z_04810 [Maricaulaceae bacterium]